MLIVSEGMVQRYLREGKLKRAPANLVKGHVCLIPYAAVRTLLRETPARIMRLRRKRRAEVKARGGRA